ncbi:hypothetical protein JYB62_13570 [Algoriphagus lutimaris]|uniref:hypothetical protein n=1 Tax=Algoriphagus lutimaris TaxID=613197 RepID=UPI00196B92A4|nr:hypothetical protein [Algoriphagus lutimaris]MBN3521033.1 hypothetical protein [Algoriphagus lutimaris]
MLKFFRRLRHYYIENNKTGKYLKYAIGEILLVMIGILLALQVNTWNQERQNRKLEKEYLKGFIQDLNQDSLDLSKASVNIKLCVDVIIELGDSIPKNYYENKFFNTAMNQVKIDGGNVVTYKNYSELVRSFGEKTTQLTQHRSFDLARVTFDDLLSTGNIDVIQNEKLRNEIQNYYSGMTAELDYESNAINPSFNTYLNVLQEIGLTPYNETPIEEIKDNSESRQKLITSLKFLLEANVRHLYWSSGLNEKVKKMEYAIEMESTKL